MDDTAPQHPRPTQPPAAPDWSPPGDEDEPQAPHPADPQGTAPGAADEDELLPASREGERALRLADEALGRRERTVAELRTVLERKRVEPAAIDAVVDELRAAGWLDDARYAQRFAEDKRALERWGSERIARELRRRGVAPDIVEETVTSQDRADELATALLLLEQRLPTPPADDRERNRAWRLLIRRGYEPELAYEAVRRHERGDDQRDAA